MPIQWSGTLRALLWWPSHQESLLHLGRCPCCHPHSQKTYLCWLLASVACPPHLEHSIPLAVTSVCYLCVPRPHTIHLVLWISSVFKRLAPVLCLILFLYEHIVSHKFHFNWIGLTWISVFPWIVPTLGVFDLVYHHSRKFSLILYHMLFTLSRKTICKFIKK